MRASQPRPCCNLKRTNWVALRQARKNLEQSMTQLRRWPTTRASEWLTISGSRSSRRMLTKNVLKLLKRKRRFSSSDWRWNRNLKTKSKPRKWLLITPRKTTRSSGKLIRSSWWVRLRRKLVAEPTLRKAILASLSIQRARLSRGMLCVSKNSRLRESSICRNAEKWSEKPRRLTKRKRWNSLLSAKS